MNKDAIPMVARVECRSEGRRGERPMAVWSGGQRLEITDVIDRAMISSERSGEPNRNRWWVELEDGTRCELTRVLPDGDWRVSVQR